VKTIVIAAGLLCAAGIARGQTAKKDTAKASSTGSPANHAKPASTEAKKYQEFTPGRRDTAGEKSSAKTPPKTTRPKGDTAAVKKPSSASSR